jgi:hypothetical protein
VGVSIFNSAVTFVVSTAINRFGSCLLSREP